MNVIDNIKNTTEDAVLTSKKILNNVSAETGGVINNIKNNIPKDAVDSLKNAAKDVKDNVQKNTDKALSTIKDISKNISKNVHKKVYIEYGGKKVCEDEILSKINERWNELNTRKKIKDVKIYYKVEDNTAYCVVNDTINIDIKMD